MVCDVVVDERHGLAGVEVATVRPILTIRGPMILPQIHACPHTLCQVIFPSTEETKVVRKTSVNREVTRTSRAEVALSDHI